MQTKASGVQESLSLLMEFAMSHPPLRLAHDVWSLIPAAIANEFQVLPAGLNGRRVKLVAKQRLDREQIKQTEKTLKFRLGRPVKVVPIHESQLTPEVFDQVLQYYYREFSDETISRPVSSDLITVVVLDRNTMRRRTVCDELTARGFKARPCQEEAEAVRILGESDNRVGFCLVSADFSDSVANLLEDIQVNVPSVILGVFAESNELLPFEQADGVRYFSIDPVDAFDLLALDVQEVAREVAARVGSSR